MNETREDLERIARRRLYPSFTDPNWLVLRARREIFRKWLAGFTMEDPLVLDVGGRHQPYRSLFTNKGLRYIAADLRPTALVDVLANGEALPFARDTFDLVISSQVLEYVSNPFMFVAEIHRVLKPGGRLLLSAPAIYPIDSDSDRWRFLPAGLKSATRAFSNVEIAAEGGSAAGLLRTCNVWLNAFAHYRAIRFLLSLTLFPLFNGLAVLFDDSRIIRSGAFSANYSLWAKK